MTTRLYIGDADDLADQMRTLLNLAGDDRVREVVWVPGERAVDVPDDVAEAYIPSEAKPARRNTTRPAKKAAKAVPAPAPVEDPEE